MSKIQCKCGNILGIGKIPNPNEWLTISDCEFDNYQGQVNSEDLYKKMSHYLECDRCSRLLFFPNGFENAPIVYTKSLL